jgi:hypothetical protein
MMKNLIAIVMIMLLLNQVTAQTYINKEWKMGRALKMKPTGPAKIKREIPFQINDHPCMPGPPRPKMKKVMVGSDLAVSSPQVRIPSIAPGQPSNWGFIELKYNSEIRMLYEQNGWF